MLWEERYKYEGDLLEAVYKSIEKMDELIPILSVVSLQLLAYYISVARGCDVDKPKNLAKSVTVE